MPVVEIPHALYRFTNEREQIPVTAGTVGTALAELWREFPELQSRVVGADQAIYPYLVLSLNGTALPRTQFEQLQLTSDDRLEIVALAEGG